MNNESKWVFVKDTATRIGVPYTKLKKIINKLDNDYADGESRRFFGLSDGTHFVYSKDWKRVVDWGYSKKLMQHAVKIAKT